MSVDRYERNRAGHDYAVGDIHGCFSRLQIELDRIGFDPDRDRLFAAGDLVDRGPESHLVTEWLAKPWFHAVRGNHDDMAMRWPRGLMPAANRKVNGGAWNMTQPPAEQWAVAHAMERLPIAIEIQTANGAIGIVHGDVPYQSWAIFTSILHGSEGEREARHARQMAMWSRERIEQGDERGVPDLRALIVGHTPLEQTARLGNVYYIDTGAVFGGEFTILDLATLELV